MKISKLVSVFGILFIIYGLIFGLKLNFVSDWDSYSFTSSYSLISAVSFLDCLWCMPDIDSINLATKFDSRNRNLMINNQLIPAKIIESNLVVGA